MFPRLLLPVAATLAVCAPALAAPQVSADIAPVQSIVAAVMTGGGAPQLIVPPGVSEHTYALRPSEAGALEAADLVVWVGPRLTPWLADPIAALAGDATILTLTEATGLRLLDVREGGPFEPHAHGAEDHAEDHGSDHDHDHDHDHDEPGHAADHDHRSSAGPDPHVWLDPQNAAAIADAVAVKLAEIDPENAALYAANAAAFAAEMEALSIELEARLAPLRGRAFFVFHDAYHYFEERFALPAAGSIALNDAEAPRAARVAEIRERLAREDVVCVFAEPQFEPKLIATVIEGAPIRTGALDPLGAGLEPGPGLYPALMRGLADGLAACLDPKS